MVNGNLVTTDDQPLGAEPLAADGAPWSAGRLQCRAGGGIGGKCAGVDPCDAGEGQVSRHVESL